VPRYATAHPPHLEGTNENQPNADHPDDDEAREGRTTALIPAARKLGTTKSRRPIVRKNAPEACGEDSSGGQRQENCSCRAVGAVQKFADKLAEVAGNSSERSEFGEEVYVDGVLPAAHTKPQQPKGEASTRQ